MSTPSKIGPNSIIQTVGALETAYGKQRTEELLTAIGQGHWIGNLPSEMVEESKFHALVTALEKEIGESATAGILKESGERTAKYLLRVRIPGPFQKIVKLLPAGLAFKVFLYAISKNAWTFAGSGEFDYDSKPSQIITVKVTCQSHPVVGNFYLGTFTALLRELVNPATTISADIRRKVDGIDCRYACSI
ncbi:MAG: bacteriochlorophyll 4-vinyl reductase [Chlorobiaceae bacterium]|nr:bacteriochlorophyll 4-vinyl reductase [Chlorobiaceae bacterium]